MTNVVEQFADLFEGRQDAYGTEEGGCMRVDKPTSFSWKFYAERHLEGEVPIGVYPMAPFVELNNGEPTGNTWWGVKWGCVDFDVKTKGKPSWDYETESDAHVAAVNLQRVLQKLGATSWIERTRSCGRHVWVFSKGWVSAATMRRSLLVASQVAGCSTREVNPKQETLGDGQLGNYVRLPYPGGLTWGHVSERMIFALSSHGAATPLTVRAFVELAIDARTSPETLQKIADKYTPPRKVQVEVQPYNGDRSALQGLNAAGKTVFHDGPADGDRSKGLTYIAYQARLSGLTPSDAFAILKQCTWNKFHGRPDEDRRIMETVQRAWA